MTGFHKWGDKGASNRCGIRDRGSERKQGISAILDQTRKEESDNRRIKHFPQRWDAPGFDLSDAMPRKCIESNIATLNQLG